ncbi:MAG: hypothetical protein ACYCU5_16040 [Actinomycetes bacterium]
MPLTIHEALTRYGQEAGQKPAATIRRYLDGGGDGSDASLSGFLADLERQGLGRGSIDLYRRQVQAFYRHFGIPAPKARQWRYDSSEAKRPALSRGLIGQMIQAALADRTSPRDCATLALATVYGLRATEIAAIRQQDVQIESQRLYIRTAKGGRPRWCWLPPCLHEAVDVEWGLATVSRVESAFPRLWRAVSGARKPPGVGLHAIRRALVRDLSLAGVPPQDIGRFMRWARGGASAGAERMVSWYANPSEEVTAEGAGPARVEADDTEQADAPVWGAHPYLGAWRR